MKTFLIYVLFIVLILGIELGKEMGAVVVPILASLILLIWAIAFWRGTLWAIVEKKYTALFIGCVSIYTVGSIFRVLMYN